MRWLRIFTSLVFTCLSLLTGVSGQNIISPKDITTQNTSARYDSLTVRIERLGDKVNTPYSEFSPFQIGDSLLYFSALRPYTLDESNNFIPAEFYTQLYKSAITSNGWQPSVIADKRLNRGKYHVANATFTHSGNTVYFTRCVENSEGSKQCQIYSSFLNNRGRWSKPAILPSPINVPSFSTTQPFLAEGSAGPILFFASDRAGGQGGFDIWYSSVQDNAFSKPVNLGSIINTPGNEQSPFYFDGALYFSSDAHAGLGGFDIFESRGNYNSWSRPRNLGTPMNTALDELNFTISADSLSGYFTSNRPGSLHLYEETCCYDIYHYEWERVKLPDTDSIPILASNDSLARLLLPITLFFDNDQPDPRSKSPITSLDYLSTLRVYAALQERYEEEYAKNLGPEAANKAKVDIRTFFDSEVQGGFVKLELLGSYILNDLKNGNNVRLTVSGFASPLNTSEYNYNLSQRRIVSLQNYLSIYMDSALVPYMNNNAGGPRLEIKSNPVGENKSKKFVSDNPNDVRNSVYSIAAAKERRIEISNYESGTWLPENQQFAQITLLDASTVFQGIAGQNIIASLPFINSGSAPLLLQNISSSCQCIQSSFAEFEVKPGEKGIIYLLIQARENGDYQSDLKIDFSPSEQSLVLPLRWTFKTP